MSDLTPARVRELLEYDPATGVFTWRPRPRGEFATENAWAVWNSKHAGKRAGGLDANGYWRVRVGTMHKASRLAWAHVHGVWPDRVDHISGDTGDDRIVNLRDVSQAVNCQNRALSCTNKHGVYGVYRGKGGTGWRAQINVHRRRINLGSFRTFESAVAARQAAEMSFGFHPNHGRIAPELKDETQ